MTEPAAPREPGTIITFYSYKGGTGRSMALANVAWILASNGHRVLVVDWDLEAPGLHRYFAPFMLDPDLTDSPGVIDIVDEYVTAAMTQAGGSDAPENWADEYANVLRYATSLDYAFPEYEKRKGWIDFIPAGRQGGAYATRMNSFSWQNFYDRFGGGGFIERVKARMKAEYDYILIDSRTGVSDTSGICTVQLPDLLAVCFTFNRQSIEGASAVAASVLAQRGEGRPLQVFPIPTRVEKAEKERLDVAREVAREAFAPMLGPGADQYWGEVEVSYEPFYAYEEVLAVFGDKPLQASSLLASMERITAWLTGDRVKQLVAVDESTRQSILAKYARQSRKALAKAAPVSPRAEYVFYVSYSRKDLDEHLERFVDDLTERVRTLKGLPHSASVAFVDYLAAAHAGEEWSATASDALQRSRVLVPIVSPALLDSEQAGRELQSFLAREPRAIYPVVWVKQPMPESSPLAQLQMTSEAFPEPYKNLGLGSVMRLRRYSATYQDVLETIAKQVVEMADHASLPDASPDALESMPNAFASQTSNPGFRKIAEAIATMDRENVVDALETYIIPTLRTGSILPSVDDALLLLRNLRGCRLYDLLERAADEVLKAGQRDPQIELLYAESLLEQGKTTAALAVLTPLKGAAAKVLTGEAYKRLYIETGAPTLPRNQQNLARAVAAYEEVYLPTSDLRAGINLIALLMRADRDNVNVTRIGKLTPDAMAESILNQIQARVSSGKAEPEDYAIAAEASLGLHRIDRLNDWLRSYAEEPGVDTYSLSRLLWQFEKVWAGENDASKDVVARLRSIIWMRAGGSVSLSASELASVDAGYWPNVARIVRIVDTELRPLGTGFVAFLDVRLVLITCTSVLEPHGQAPDAFAFMEGARMRLGTPLFKAPPGELDVTAFLITPQGVAPDVAATPPKPSANIIVMGHPNERPSEVDLQNRSVLDVDLPRIHYRAPIVPGSEGGPIFNSRGELVGVHRSAAQRRPRLHGKPGTYEAAEGIWIGAIIEAMRKSR